MSEIERLDGIDRIRLRPAVIFGSGEKYGVINCIKYIVALMLPYSESIKVSLDEQGYVVIKAYNMDIRKLRSWELGARENGDITYKDGSINDYYVIKAVCGEMIIVNSYGRNTVEYALYKEGKLIEHGIRDALPNEKYSVTIKYKPSHQVFNYDSITKQDLEFISVGE